MTSIIADIVEAKREAFDAQRELFFEETVACHLLDRDDGSGASPFSVIAEIQGGWFIEYSNFRGQFELRIATMEAGFAAKVETADAVAVGEEVYEIERGDTVPPQGANPVWRIRCNRTGERFEVP